MKLIDELNKLDKAVRLWDCLRKMHVSKKVKRISEVWSVFANKRMHRTYARSRLLNHISLA